MKSRCRRNCNSARLDPQQEYELAEQMDGADGEQRVHAGAGIACQWRAARHGSSESLGVKSYASVVIDVDFQIWPW